MDGVEILKESDYGIKLEFDSGRIAVDEVIHRLMERYSIVDITISDPPMEEIIRSIYEAPPDDDREPQHPGGLPGTEGSDSRT